MRPHVPLTSWLPAVGMAVLMACTSSPTAPSLPDCTYTLSTTTIAVPAGGGPALVAVAVATGSACAWTAQTSTAWLTVTAGASGAGPGAVTVSAQANPTTTARTGTLTVAGATVTVQQEGLAACAYAIAPGSASFGAGGGRSAIAVSTGVHCAWQTSTEAPWIRVIAGASGTGPGTVEYAVDDNPGPIPRSGVLTVAGLAFTINQAGDVSACTYQVSPARFDVCMVWSGDRISRITTQDGCPWTAVSTAAWITVAGGTTGSGSGDVVLQGVDNWDPRRTGIVEVRWPTPTAGQNILVDQGGCQYAVTRDTIDMAVAGGNAQFDVLQQSDPTACGGPLQNACIWSAVSHVPWITITTAMPRAGDDQVRFVVSTNASAAPRTGTITVRDKVVTVRQAGQ